jgi:sensor histidine kinase YesM
MKLMSKFIEENNYEEFKRYYEKINDKIESFKSQVTVYNGIADAIINQYYSIATSKGIDMKVSGRFPVDCDIDTYDLCTIFSNILSNAVEAAERAAEKIIKLECKYSDNKELFIFLNNTYKDIGIIESKKIRTRKNNSEYHGFGMENIEDSVKKYKGSYYYEIEDNEFKVTILLNY